MKLWGEVTWQAASETCPSHANICIICRGTFSYLTFEHIYSITTWTSPLSEPYSFEQTNSPSTKLIMKMAFLFCNSSCAWWWLGSQKHLQLWQVPVHTTSYIITAFYKLLTYIPTLSSVGLHSIHSLKIYSTITFQKIWFIIVIFFIFWCLFSFLFVKE